VEWCHQGYTPSFDEHVNLSTASAGIQVLCVGMLVGMGDAATKEVFEWMIGSNNRVVRACAEVTRFMDDMADFKVRTYYVFFIIYIVAEIKRHQDH
jgi:(-)-germacrene D synthase